MNDKLEEFPEDWKKMYLDAMSKLSPDDVEEQKIILNEVERTGDLDFLRNIVNKATSTDALVSFFQIMINSGKYENAGIIIDNFLNKYPKTSTEHQEALKAKEWLQSIKNDRGNVGSTGKKIKIPIMKEEDITIPPFDEIDRTDLIVGVGEIYGRDGTFARTDLGRWFFEAPGFMKNVFLESNLTLSCHDSITCKSLMEAVQEDAKRIYSRLMKEKYEPLFRKYNLKGFEEVIRLNISREGLEEWLKSRWIPGKIITIPDGGVQNGNVGMYAHTWENINVENEFRYQIDYYIDFPGKVFQDNPFGGSQSPEKIAEYGKKIFSPKMFQLKTKMERDVSIRESYDRFVKGELVGF